MMQMALWLLPASDAVFNDVSISVDLVVRLMCVQHFSFIGPHCNNMLALGSLQLYPQLDMYIATVLWTSTLHFDMCHL